MALVVAAFWSIAPLAALEHGPVAVRSVAIGGDETATTITIDLARPTSVGVFALADPARLVVDLPGASFEIAKSVAQSGHGLIGPWRFGAFAAGRGRIVFDARDAVRIDHAELIAGDATRPTRIVVALVRATRAEMLAAKPLTLGPPAAPQAPVAPVATTPGGKTDRAAVTPPAPLVRPARRVVAIDAGHGGVDAGTVSPATGTPEKTVVLEMARALARTLQETGRYEPRLTRDSDVFVPLSDRVSIARAARAELLVSIHADAEFDHSVRGATVYTLAEKASDAQAAALAAKENHSDAIAGLIVEEAHDEVADILADLTRRESRRFSHEIARDILDEYRRNGRLVKGTAHRQASLKVLRVHDFPAVLVEIGFLSNKEDEAQMVSPEWRDRTARSLTAAIDRWFAERGNAGGSAAP